MAVSEQSGDATDQATSQRRTVVFLHGIGTKSGMWHDHIRDLPEFDCLAPDLPGHGTATTRPWTSLKDAAAEVTRLIESTPAGKADLVGLSLGGAVGIELMNTRPELVGRVLIDGVSAVPWRPAPLMLAAVALVSPFIHTRPVRWAIAKALSVQKPRRTGFYAELDLVSGRTIRRAIRDAISVRLRRIDFPGPVLLVAGQHDVAAARVSDATLAAELPNAEARYLPRAWHAWAGTDPNLHRAMVSAFLRDEPLPNRLLPETAKPRTR